MVVCGECVLNGAEAEQQGVLRCTWNDYGTRDYWIIQNKLFMVSRI